MDYAFPHNIMDFKGKSATYATWLSVVYLRSRDLISLSFFPLPYVCLLGKFHSNLYKLVHVNYFPKQVIISYKISPRWNFRFLKH